MLHVRQTAMSHPAHRQNRRRVKPKAKELARERLVAVFIVFLVTVESVTEAFDDEIARAKKYLSRRSDIAMMLEKVNAQSYLLRCEIEAISRAFVVPRLNILAGFEDWPRVLATFRAVARYYSHLEKRRSKQPKETDAMADIVEEAARKLESGT